MHAHVIQRMQCHMSRDMHYACGTHGQARGLYTWTGTWVHMDRFMGKHGQAYKKHVQAFKHIQMSGTYGVAHNRFGQLSQHIHYLP